METARLPKPQQQPAHAERLLHALVVRANLIPEGSHQIRNFTSMPKALRIIAGLAVTTNGHTWSCWTHEGRTWLFTGELSLHRSRASGVPVLLVDVYDETGPKDSGLWAYRKGMWQRCADSRWALTQHPGIPVPKIAFVRKELAAGGIVGAEAAYSALYGSGEFNCPLSE